MQAYCMYCGLSHVDGVEWPNLFGPENIWPFDDSDGEETTALHDEPPCEDNKALLLRVSIFLQWKSL